MPNLWQLNLNSRHYVERNNHIKRLMFIWNRQKGEKKYLTLWLYVNPIWLLGINTNKLLYDVLPEDVTFCVVNDIKSNWQFLNTSWPLISVEPTYEGKIYIGK